MSRIISAISLLAYCTSVLAGPPSTPDDVDLKFADAFGQPAAICYMFYESIVVSLNDKSDSESLRAVGIAREYADAFAEIFKTAYESYPNRGEQVISGASDTVRYFLENDADAFIDDQLQGCPNTLSAIGGAHSQFFEDTQPEKQKSSFVELVIASQEIAVKSIAEQCSAEDLRQLSEMRPDISTMEAFEFGTKIQSAVRQKNVAMLYELARTSLMNGPRQSVASRLSFDEVFPPDWRARILEAAPPCAPFGWRGFTMGRGDVWYDKLPNGEWSILSINGANTIESSEREPWLVDGNQIGASCFSYEWYSSDNYQEFHEVFAPEVEYAEFRDHIGRYMGSEVPFKAIVPSWDESEQLTLARELSQCNKLDDKEVSYETIMQLSASSCRSLAPALSGACREVRVVKVSGPCGGSIGCRTNVSIYGLVREPVGLVQYVVPLANFDTENSARDYVEAHLLLDD